jgi:hypothetical protein
MVSAELALAIPTVVAVLVLGLSAVQMGVDQVRCVQAAGLGARALVRGDAEARVRADVARAAPTGAIVSWSGRPVVTVRVSHRARLLGLLDLPVTIGAEAAGRLESGAP